MFDAPGCSGGEYANDIEARLLELRLLFREILLGDSSYGCLFVFGDGFEWIAESRAAPELHLHENEGVTVTQDQVQLPVARPVVALDERIALPD